MVDDPIPAQMNMKTHDSVEYSGLPSPSRTLPYLLNASAMQARTQPKTKIWTRDPNERVAQLNSCDAVAAAWSGHIVMATTVATTAATVQPVRNKSLLLLVVLNLVSSSIASARMERLTVAGVKFSPNSFMKLTNGLQ